MAGKIIVDTIQNGSGTSSDPKGIAKAWVNFNGTNGSIRASNNVTSVTRVSAGTYTVNFTTAFADANYCITCSTISNGSSKGLAQAGDFTTARTTTACTILTYQYTGETIADFTIVNVVANGN